LTVVGITLLTGIYHVSVRGELEVLALALVFLALGCMVAFPWGLRGQLALTGAAVVAYLGALFAGVTHQTPLPQNGIGLGLALAFTVLGARLAERSHLKLLRRDAE